MFSITIAFIAGWYASNKKEQLSQWIGKLSTKASKKFDEWLK